MKNIWTWLCGPPPRNGQRQMYPARFMRELLRYYPEFFHDETLHMFSGSFDLFGVTTDVRPETGADIITPFTEVKGRYQNVIADPPYGRRWGDEWDKWKDYPRPKDVLREASRLCRKGGLIGILHVIVIPNYRGLKIRRVGIHPILSGPNNSVRVFNVWRKM